MVYPLAFPIKNTFEKVKGNLEALIEASWKRETREALQDVSGGDDDANGGDDDPGGDDSHGGRGSAKDRLKEIKKRFGIDAAVGDVGSAVEAGVKDAKPTVKPNKITLIVKERWARGQRVKNQCPPASNLATVGG